MKKTNTMLSVILLAAIMVFALACSNPAGAGTALAVDTPEYSIELSETQHDFGTIYELPSAPYSVTITNTGNRSTGLLNVTLSGDTECFRLVTPDIESLDLAPQEEISFSVFPREFDPPVFGSKMVMVTITGDNGISESFQASFLVESRIDLIFPNGFNGNFINDGPQEVHVVNFSPWETGLTIHFSTFDLFEISFDQTDWYQDLTIVVPPHNVRVFWVQPKTSGPYSAELLAFNTFGQAAARQLTYTVPGL
jgi:hypothetical protein